MNTLFEVPTEGYLKKLKQNAADHEVTMVLIMIDDEGDGCADTKEGRKQFEINHRKWVDIAHYLGCHAVRTNCRGPENVDKKEALKWAAESYRMLLEYAKPANIAKAFVLLGASFFHYPRRRLPNDALKYKICYADE